MLPERVRQAIAVEDVPDPAEVVSDEDEPDICRGPFAAFFGEDVVEAPLPFDGSEGVLHDGLPALVELGFGLDVGTVGLEGFCVDVAFDELSVLGRCGAKASHGAAFALLGSVLSEAGLIRLSLVLGVDAAVGFQMMSLRTGVVVVFPVVGEVVGVVGGVRCVGCLSGHGHQGFKSEVLCGK